MVKNCYSCVRIKQEVKSKTSLSKAKFRLGGVQAFIDKFSNTELQTLEFCTKRKLYSYISQITTHLKDSILNLQKV